MDVATLVSQLGGFLYSFGTFVIVLSVIVFVHEYGHYIVGRWSGIHPEVFSLGFGPVLASRVDRRGTRWQIAAIPFGGFVKFLGDADAASGKDAAAIAAAEANPAHLRRTMHGAPLWARSATVAAGPIFNFILSLVIFAGLTLSEGRVQEPLTVGELKAMPQSFELQPGDVILGIEGQDTPKFSDPEAWGAFRANIPVKDSLDYRVERNGRVETVSGPYLSPTYISGVDPHSAADEAGLKIGDVITAVDGTPIFTFDALKEHVEAANGAELKLSVWNAGETRELVLSPKRRDEPTADGGFQTYWRIGVRGEMPFDPAMESISPIEAVEFGAIQVWRMITTQISGLKHIITGQISTCNLSGPVAIAETAGTVASQGATNLIWLIAALSTGIGLVNLFPVPVLDGGHLVFFAYEAVTRRAPNERAMQVLMSIGLALILGLMLFSIGNDTLFC